MQTVDRALYGFFEHYFINVNHKCRITRALIMIIMNACKIVIIAKIHANVTSLSENLEN